DDEEDRPWPELDHALASRVHGCSIAGLPDGTFHIVSLHGRTIEQTAALPDGRTVTVHVGVPEDPYIKRADLNTVDVELRSGGHVLAAVTTVLDPDQESE